MSTLIEPVLLAPPTLGRARPPVVMLQVEVWLLFLIPAGLRFAPLGAVGNPAIIFGVLLFGVWAVSVLAPSIQGASPCRPLRLVLALFWGSVMLSYALMNRQSVPADELSNADRYLISMISFSGLLLFAAEGLRNWQELMRVLRTAVAAIATMSTVALLQSRADFDATTYIGRLPFFSTFRPLDSVYGRSGLARPAGTATHPIEFGVVAGLGLALAIHVVLYDRVWSPARRWTAFALIAVAVPISISRSALLVGLIVFITFLLGTTPRLRLQAAAIFTFFAMVVFVAVPGLIGTLSGYIALGGNDESVATRTSDYSAVAKYLRESPWLGRGPGTFLPRLRILDNQYLMTLIETGIVGMVVLLALFSSIAVLGRIGSLLHTSEGDRNLGQMFVGCGLGIIAASSTFDAVSFPMFTMFTALLAGLAGSYWRFGRDHARFGGSA